MRIELTLSAWKAEVLPLNYARVNSSPALAFPARAAQARACAAGARAGEGRSGAAGGTQRETDRPPLARKGWWGEADSNRRR